MMEITDTSNSFMDEIPDGEHQFKVVRVVKKYGTNNTPFYLWKLEYDGIEGNQIMLPSLMGDLLRILECKEISPNKFQWDTEDVAGLYFSAVISHEPDKKDPTKRRQNMAQFKKAVLASEDIPF